MGRPAYTQNDSKWGRFEFGLLASEDAELTMPHHFEEASVYAGLAQTQNLIKMTYFSKYPEFCNGLKFHGGITSHNP